MQFLVEEDDPGQWRWRLIGLKNEMLLRSDETYDSLRDASQSASTFARTVLSASARISAPVPALRRAPRPGPRRPIFAPA
jgi:uncharacterized protein YegP (UPF0339 family)